MAISEDSLGGRLPLLAPAALDADQQKLYDALLAKTVPWANESGFQAATADGRVIGPFNAMLRSPRISQAMLALTNAEGEFTALSERVRQVVILTVGALWRADYELYAHAAVGAQAGFDAATVGALVAGQKPAALAADESLAYDIAHSLTATHQLAPALYAQAVATFGEKGVVDLIYLAGHYMIISGLLNTFAVPAPAAF
ncbi:MAG: carboxymuconolactone decarboxylase family protein [Janthinobacterium lividum]